MDIVILSNPSIRFSKRFKLINGQIDYEIAKFSSYYWYKTKPASNIYELSELLKELEPDSHSLIIREQLAEDVDTDKPMRRRLYRSERPSGGLKNSVTNQVFNDI